MIYDVMEKQIKPNNNWRFGLFYKGMQIVMPRKSQMKKVYKSNSLIFASWTFSFKIKDKATTNKAILNKRSMYFKKN